VVGKGSKGAEAAEVLAVLVKAKRLVLQEADAGVEAAIAQVLVAGRAVAALATRGYVGRHHVIAGLDPGDPGAHLIQIHIYV
jgi:hypothetical protein